ncbi:hypothetical protein HGB47_14945 [Leptospira yasudae]|uniref:GTP pyrophosphokinase n=1 Tax=Leptospira yasudae TaxID=2202201 RepID=UPI001C4F0F34|nr:hypothetical protein [Leptospira yasudae]MBW0434914.1 hypothetical protein [Leptospira yasudae]
MKKEYDATTSFLFRLIFKSVRQLKKGIKEEGLSLPFQPEFRIKSWASFSEKCKRLHLNISDLSEMQDLLGIRIITLFQKDQESFLPVIERIFEPIKKYNTRNRLGENKFGYGATHYVVKVPQNLFNKKKHKPYTIEIQIKSLAEHLWASASHRFQYKKEKFVPKHLQRVVNRTAALLELIDQELDNVLNEQIEYSDLIKDLNLEDRLTITNLPSVLNVLWPKENRLSDEPYSHLLTVLSDKKIFLIRDLVDIILPHRALIIEESRNKAKKLSYISDKHGVVNETIEITLPGKTSSHQGVTPKLLSQANKGIFYGHCALTFTLFRYLDGSELDMDSFFY